MICKCFSILLLCSVPLIGMERKSSGDIATDLRNNLKHVDEIAKEHDAIIKGIEKRTGLDLSSEKVKEKIKSVLRKAKEEQPAPSQVSPCLDTLEDYLKQPDTTLASNAVRDCIRKLVRFCRGNQKHG